MHFVNRIISLEVFKNSKLAFPPSVPCIFFYRRRPAWECDFCVFQHLCGARVLSVRFRPFSYSSRITFDDTSNVIFVILAWMLLKPSAGHVLWLVAVTVTFCAHPYFVLLVLIFFCFITWHCFSMTHACNKSCAYVRSASAAR